MRGQLVYLTEARTLRLIITIRGLKARFTCPSIVQEEENVAGGYFNSSILAKV